MLMRLLLFIVYSLSITTTVLMFATHGITEGLVAYGIGFIVYGFVFSVVNFQETGEANALIAYLAAAIWPPVLMIAMLTQIEKMFGHAVETVANRLSR